MEAREATGAATARHHHPLSADALVCVTRDPDDDRTAYVPLSALRNPHMATDCGGRIRALPRPMLAAYVFCDIAAGVAHSCQHDGRRHSIKVLVDLEHTDTAVCDQLRERCRAFRPRARRAVVG